MCERVCGDRFVGFALALTFILPSLRAIGGDTVPTMAYLVPPLLLGAVAGWRTLLRLRVPRHSAVDVVAGAALLWISWQSFSGGWSAGADQIDQDLVLLGLMVAYTVTTVLAVTARSVEIMVSWVIGASALVSGFVLAQYLLLGDLSGYTSVVYDYYLTISLLLALGCAGAALRVFATDRLRWRPVGLTLFLFAGLGLSLARGVLVFVALVLAVLLPLSGLERVLHGTEARTRLVGKVAAVAPIMAIVVMGAAASTIERTRDRILRMLSGMELEAGGRGDLWNSALEGIDRAWSWGHGLGSSGLTISGVEQEYPHNLFLQVWLDGGLPGVVLLGAFLVLPLALVGNELTKGRVRLNASWLVPLAMLTILFLEYAKSEHVYTARSIVVMAVVLVASLDAAAADDGQPECNQ